MIYNCILVTESEPHVCLLVHGRCCSGLMLMSKLVTKHITLHANGEPLLMRSSSHSLLSSSATILLVWSANGDAPFQGKFQVNLLNDDTYVWNCATSSYRQIE